MEVSPLMCLHQLITLFGKQHLQSECDLLEVTCPTCQSALLQKELRVHYCPHVPIGCPFSELGCATEARDLHTKGVKLER